VIKNGTADALQFTIMPVIIRFRTLWQEKESLMFKLATLIGSLAFFFSSWFAGFTLPRFTQGPGDYILMPLIGYIMIIVAAQVAAKIIPQKQQ
jgi:arginine exporter protein ArgO